MLQCVVVCCSVMQFVAVCCSELQCDAVAWSISPSIRVRQARLARIPSPLSTVCCSALQCVAGVAVCYSVLQVLQCVAV